MTEKIHVVKSISINGAGIPLKGVISVASEPMADGTVKITLLCDKDCEFPQ